MSKRTKILLIAIVLILVGCAFFAGALSAYDWDFAAMNEQWLRNK